MGELMRQYWVPALLSHEVAIDGPPVRLKLLGEELIAFRASSGRVGIMDHRCPHRRASLFFGRNEEDGLRCVYHGWKFAADGTCLDQPNVPPQLGTRYRVDTRAYRTTERAGVVWAYMGSRAEPPPLPNFPAFAVPQHKLNVWCELRECSYLQAIEGELDTSHAGFLHMGSVKPQDSRGPQGTNIDVENRAVEYKVADTPAGILAGGYRPADQDQIYWRFANFLLPFWTQPPPCPFGSEAVARAWVPLDDTHTMLFAIATESYMLAPGPKANRPPDSQIGMTFDYEFLPNTSDWFGRWRLAANRQNDYRIDRAVQRQDSYSGIEGLDIQDSAMQESIAPGFDPSREHLVPSDLAIAHIRHRLLRAVAALKEHGTPPPGVDQPDAYQTWCGFLTAPARTEWLKVYADNLPRAAAVVG
jgi:phenylpropionate dioxygenase-like ring-hydroxylating dioxygenase large terminal subunit